MSKDHPKKDICDKLAGDYPKDFIFDGWHPQCFCYVTPITIPPEETAKLTEMMLNGEDWRRELARLKRGREITSYPDNFKQWVTDNADNIQAARDRGTEPYFIRNNARAIDNIINPPKALTPLQIAEDTSIPATPQEIAQKRHAARTPADIQRIERAWQQREIKNLTIETARYGNNALMDSYIKSMRDCRINGDKQGFISDYNNAKKLLEQLRKENEVVLTYFDELNLLKKI